MQSYEDHIDIDASLAVVWALTVDIESWPLMFSTVTHVERVDNAPLVVGSQARIKQPGQPTRTWTVTDLQPERIFAWSTSAKGYTMTATHTLAALSTSRTSNRLRIDLDGPLAGIVDALAGRKLRKILATENIGFQKAAVSGTQPRA